MENCKLINTTLSFEFAKGIDADITTKIDSVFNPVSVTITAPEIIDALSQRVAHGIFGYTDVDDDWYDAYMGVEEKA